MAPSSDGSGNGDVSPDSLLRLLGELRDERLFDNAATELWNRLHSYLEWRITRSLADRYRGQGLEESVANRAFESFLSGMEGGEYSIQDQGGLKALLAQIALNKLRSKLRSLRRDEAFFDESVTGEPENPSGRAAPGNAEKPKRFYRTSHPVDPNRVLDSDCEAPDLEGFFRASGAAIRLVILERIESLPDELREFLILRCVDQYTDDEISRRMDISPQAPRYMLEDLQEIFRSFLPTSER